MLQLISFAFVDASNIDDSWFRSLLYASIVFADSQQFEAEADDGAIPIKCDGPTRVFATQVRQSHLAAKQTGQIPCQEKNAAAPYPEKGAAVNQNGNGYETAESKISRETETERQRNRET